MLARTHDQVIGIAALYVIHTGAPTWPLVYTFEVRGFDSVESHVVGDARLYLRAMDIDDHELGWNASLDLATLGAVTPAVGLSEIKRIQEGLNGGVHVARLMLAFPAIPHIDAARWQPGWSSATSLQARQEKDIAVRGNATEHLNEHGARTTIDLNTIDINTLGAALVGLSGIGPPKDADKVIAGRPYASVDEAVAQHGRLRNHAARWRLVGARAGDRCSPWRTRMPTWGSSSRC